MIPLVFVHGGGGDARTWDLLLPELGHRPTLAVDLPGRGRHPAPFDEITLAACGASVAADVDEAGFDDVVLVGHSMAGCSMPSIVSNLGSRVRHAVFIACTVPSEGHSALDMVDPSIREMAREAMDESKRTGPKPMDPELARLLIGNDLDDEQFAWCVERMLPEAPGLTMEPVHLAPLETVERKTWVRTLFDAILPPDKQLEFVANAGVSEVVDIDAGHMVMISRVKELAGILDGLADV